MGTTGTSNPGQVSYLSDKDRLGKFHIDNDIRVQAGNKVQFRAAARPVNSFGAHKGQGVEIEKYQKMATNTTAINELQSLPLKRPVINFVQTQIDEYGDGLLITEKARTIAEYSVDETLKSILATNIAETLDKVAATEFQLADVFATPRNDDAHVYDTDGTVSTAADVAIDSEFFRWLMANLKDNNVPKFDGQNYLAIINPFTAAEIFKSTEAGGWVDSLKYTRPEMLISGELGSYFGLRFVEENNVLSSTMGTSGFTGEMIIVGDDAIAEAIAKPESVMAEDWDFNRFHAIAWNAFLGYKKVWTHSTDGQHSLVRVWST